MYGSQWRWQVCKPLKAVLLLCLGCHVSLVPFKTCITMQRGRMNKYKPMRWRKRRGASQGKKDWETNRDREGVSERWPLTHLVGQGHKRQCLPGLQWSMKPPGECNRRSLEPPYRLLTNQPTNSLKGSELTKATGCSDLPHCQVPGCQQKRREGPYNLACSLIQLLICASRNPIWWEEEDVGKGYELRQNIWKTELITQES